MTRILKPVPGKAVEYLSQICAQYFREIKGYRIVEHSLGNNFTGRIDLLATDGSRVYLVTIGTSDFPHALFRSLMGYSWFSENREFLKRIYSPEEIDITKPVSLIILSQDFPSGSCSMCEQACTVPVSLYRYRLFGAGDDPDISIESVSNPAEEPIPPEEDLELLRKSLGIEEARLTDREIRDFRTAIGL
ncbi:MAG TPA: hypothetical protein PLA83_04045 [Deltaproteobacteria bacterium]|jgi:hypothetical protein|nr:hypothetical protein [Deltaproteobacteria bacterium]HQI01512.1 hypothetical protein [Deltaproteobacteria bacterium]HQJ07591.1 hypothetical protein [Deltaproteobacteria bacterium]